jgi:hypothetical protein
MDNHPVDQLFRQKLGNHPVQPGSHAWELLASRLPVSQPKPVRWYQQKKMWAAAACLLIGLFMPLHLLKDQTGMPLGHQEAFTQWEEPVILPLWEVKLPTIAAAPLPQEKQVAKASPTESVAEKADFMVEISAEELALYDIPEEAPLKVLVTVKLGSATGQTTAEEALVQEEVLTKDKPGKLLVTLKRFRHPEKDLAPGDTIYQGFWANVAHLLQPRKQ